MIAWLWILLACQTADWPAPILGTTYRIGKDTPSEKSEVIVDLLTTRSECVNAGVQDLEACLPRADRASGELRLAFQLRDPITTNLLPRSLASDQIRISHDRALQASYELIPHEPTSTSQLFILLIDGSGSMYERDGERIRKIYSALLKRSVIDSFFPKGDTRTGVVLLRFSDKVTGLDGKPPRVIESAEEYQDVVRAHLLSQSGGYTHLYDSLRYALTDLLDEEAIRSFTVPTAAEPAIVLVTDGFNNEAASDTCATNVDKLQSLLDLIVEVRAGQGSAIRPTVHAVGIGKPYRPGTKPEGVNRKVTANALCGQYATYPIDPALEDAGMDHVSMKWLAEVGGGNSYVKDSSQELSAALETAAATRYRWFEVWYRVPDAFYHHKSFTVRLELASLARAYSEVVVHPNGWLDAPSAVRGEGSPWHQPTSFLRSLSILLPGLATLLLLQYAAPALFNVRRALFRRARPRRRGR